MANIFGIGSTPAPARRRRRRSVPVTTVAPAVVTGSQDSRRLVADDNIADLLGVPTGSRFTVDQLFPGVGLSQDNRRDFVNTNQTNQLAEQIALLVGAGGALANANFGGSGRRSVGDAVVQRGIDIATGGRFGLGGNTTLPASTSVLPPAGSVVQDPDTGRSVVVQPTAPPIVETPPAVVTTPPITATDPLPDFTGTEDPLDVVDRTATSFIETRIGRSFSATELPFLRDLFRVYNVVENVPDNAEENITALADALARYDSAADAWLALRQNGFL